MSIRNPQHHPCPCETCTCLFLEETINCPIWKKWFREEWAFIQKLYGGEKAIEAYKKSKAKQGG